MSDTLYYILACGGTVLVYSAAWFLFHKAEQKPLMHPLITAVIVIIAALTYGEISYDDYFHYAQPIHLLLGPIIVGLAFVITEHLHVLKGHALALTIALIVGGVFSVATVWGVTVWMSDNPELLATLITKSVTTPIAVPLTQELGGLPGIAAVIVLATGTVGAVFGPSLLKLVGLSEPLEMGMSIGVASHGIGAAEVLRHNDLAGAAAGLAMGINGLLTAIILPLVFNA